MTSFQMIVVDQIKLLQSSFDDMSVAVARGREVMDGAAGLPIDLRGLNDAMMLVAEAHVQIEYRKRKLVESYLISLDKG